MSQPQDRRPYAPRWPGRASVPRRRWRRLRAGLLVAALGSGVVVAAPSGAEPAATSTLRGRDAGAQRLAKDLTGYRVGGWSLAPDKGMLFAAHVDAVGSQDNSGAVDAFEDRLGRKLDAHRVFARWDDPLSGGIVAADITRGRIPILSIRPQRLDGSELSWASLAGGSRDDDIRAHADAVGALAGPVILTLHHEPDQTDHGSAEEFVAAWRRYVAVFRDRGVSNVAWNWIITPSSFRSPPIGPGADALYPGDDVVDWISLDPYNWFACRTGMPPAWRPLREMLTPFVAWARPHGKPLMLGEWASAEDPARSTRKAEWFTEAARALADADIKAVSYYEGVGKCPWWNASSPPARRAFLDLASSALAHGDAVALLTPSVQLGPEPLKVSFDTSRSTGSQHATGSGVTRWHLDFGDGSTPADGTGPPPAAWVHTYAAGTFLAQLTVSDASGRSNTDARYITSAAEPIVTASETDISATSAELHTWVDPQRLAATVTVQWRQGGAPPGSREFQLPAGGTVRLDVVASGLAPATQTSWRVRATSAAGTTLTAERSFSTMGPPEAVTEAPTGVTPTSASLHARVTPHSLPTVSFFEWGTTSSYAHRTARVAVPDGTAPWVSQDLTGLSPGTVYHYRVVTQNSAGTAYGGDNTFTTRAD